MHTWENMVLFITMSVIETLTILTLILTLARISIQTYWRVMVVTTLIQAYIHYLLWSVESLHPYIVMMQLGLFLLHARYIFRLQWFSSIILVGACSFFYIIMQILALFLCDVTGIAQADQINVQIARTTYVQQLVSIGMTGIVIWICYRHKLGFTFFYGKMVEEKRPMRKWLLLGCMFIGNSICFVPTTKYLVDNNTNDMWLVVVVYAVITAVLLIYFYYTEKEKYMKTRQAYLVRK